jgi:hypothetical protein
MLGRTWPIASLLCLLACEPRVGHPQVKVEVTGIGYEGASMSFSIDADGRFRSESRGDTGSGTIAWTKCHGTLPPDQVEPLFASFASASSSATKKTFPAGNGSRVRTTITYSPSPGREQFPADPDEFERLDAMLRDVHAQTDDNETCKEGRDSR